MAAPPASATTASLVLDDEGEPGFDGENRTENRARSLLDAVLYEYRAEKDLRTSRILLTGEIAPGHSVDVIRSMHEQFFDQYDKKTTHITGVFFLICLPQQPEPKAYMHLLEAPSKVIYDLLRALAGGKEKKESAADLKLSLDLSSPSSSSGPSLSSWLSKSGTAANNVNNTKSTTQPGHSNSRICSFSEEVPREYSQWYVRDVRLANGMDEWPRPTDALQAVWSTLKGALELGRELRAMNDQNAATAHVMNSTSRQFLSRIPLVSQIQVYNTIEELSSIQDFLDIFDTPIDFTLESEKVWPIEPVLKF